MVSVFVARSAEALPDPTPADTEVNRWFTYLGLQPRLC